MPISPAIRLAVAERDRYRCLYCRTSQANSGQRLQIDHIIPVSLGGPSTMDNLCLACPSCNSHKQARQAAVDPQSGEIETLFHPLQQEWAEHFAWDESNTIILGLTACGRATLFALQMNNNLVVWARKRWVEAGWHPPI